MCATCNLVERANSYSTKRKKKPQPQHKNQYKMFTYTQTPIFLLLTTQFTSAFIPNKIISQNKNVKSFGLKLSEGPTPEQLAPYDSKYVMCYICIYVCVLRMISFGLWI